MAELHGWLDEILTDGIQAIMCQVSDELLYGRTTAEIRASVRAALSAHGHQPEPMTIRWSQHARDVVHPLHWGCPLMTQAPAFPPLLPVDLDHLFEP